MISSDNTIKQHRLFVLACTILPLFAASYNVAYGQTTGQGHVYYVAVNGDDTNDGSVNSPWKTVIKAISSAKPGDTVYFRQGIYRQDKMITKDFFAKGATESSRITLAGYPGETAIITSMKLKDNPNDWTKVPGYAHVYVTNLTPQQLGPINVSVQRLPNCSEDGIPLRLMSKFSENAGPEKLTGPGQWVRDIRNWKLYVWSRQGDNPGNHKTEYCHFLYGGNSTISIRHNPANDDDEADYITFKNLVIEGGYYPIRLETDHINIIDCTFRNCYADGIKVGGAKPLDPDHPDSPNNKNYWNSQYGKIENCNIYYFGENGIDITGGDYWEVKGNKIHDNVKNRGDRPFDNYTNANGIILKNNNIGTIVEDNRIYDLDSALGAITIGGVTNGGLAGEAVNCIVRNNIIYNIKGPYAVLFDAAVNCSFNNNIIADSNFTRAIICFSMSDRNRPATANNGCKILNNIFYHNTATIGSTVKMHLIYYESPHGCMHNWVSDNNIVDSSMTYHVGGQNRTFGQFRALKFEEHSRTATPSFVDAAGYDFRPTAGAVQIDAGTPDMTSLTGNKDMAGKTRDVDGNGDGVAVVDIGPYELQTAAAADNPPAGPPPAGGGDDSGSSNPPSTPGDSSGNASGSASGDGGGTSNDNTSPVLSSIGNKQVNENQLLAFTVTASDADNDTVTYTAENLPAGAVFSDGQFSWKPNYNQAGNYNITFIASDGKSQDSQTVTITVKNVNRAPVLTVIPPQHIDENQLLTFTVSATDGDNDVITYSAEHLPVGATFSDGQFSWKPNYNQAGNYNVTFVATDGKAQNSQTVTITVNNVDRAPVFDPIADKTVHQDTQLTFSVNAIDPDGDNVSYMALNIPTGANFINQTFSWKVKKGVTGSYQVTFVASDGKLQSTKTITINVERPIIVDDTCPVVRNCTPAPGAIQTPINPLIVFDITDAGKGVDPSSVSISLDGVVVYRGDTDHYTSPAGICHRIGVSSDYTYAFQPSVTWDYNQKVTITVKASDKAQNVMPDFTWSFMTEMYNFGNAQQLSAMNFTGQAQDYPATVSDTNGNIYIARCVGPAGHRNIILSRISAATGKTTANITLTNDNYDQCYVAITRDTDNQLYVAWQDNRNGNWDIYLSHSRDGTHWTVPKQITDDQYVQSRPALAGDPTDPHRVYLVWQDNSNGNWDIKMAVSENSFVTSQIKVITTDTANQTRPTIDVNKNGVVYIAWNDDRNGNLDIYASRGENGSWSSACLVKDAYNQFDAAIKAVNNAAGNVYLAWVDDSAGHEDVYYGTFKNYLPNTPLKGVDIIDDSTAADQFAPVLATAFRGGLPKVYLAWEDMRNVTTDNDVSNSANSNGTNNNIDSDIYFAELTGDSQTNILVTDDSNHANQSNPAIATDPQGYPYLVWTDDASGTKKIAYKFTSTINAQLIAQHISASAGGIAGTPPDQINSVDDICVQVPPGAFWSDVILTVSRVNTPPSASFTMVNSPSYEFGPSCTLEFAKPVTITMPYNPAQTRVTPTVYWYNPRTGVLSKSGITHIEDLTISPNLHALRFRTTHFSQYVLAR